MVNQICINLNNAAVDEIKNGNLVSAFRMLSHACQTASKSHKHVDSDGETYRYSWVDCSRSLLPVFRKHPKFSEGSAAFLWLKFLLIETPMGLDSVDDLCPCGYTWVLWFNLGIVSALLGTSVCEAGRMLLDQALRLFDRVEHRLRPEPDSKHWSLLQLAVLNNRVCVLKDLSRDREMLNGLVGIGLACSKSWSKLETMDYDFFHWVADTHLLARTAVAA
eukprot:CAMPEP_0116996364 /NCGR_PEP_ID=MMETSP0472-20121206/193_1 /TAXON_ID=693140 ORGANISM="Tiarina fusus, Strain LIS" /NCGR_SAMPLE_ID=MMETSP0472 /ASSEMBLY_ACC=CAM_ASM_000603 /LENGTH=219 /DNA_ID=CAMNT_0004694957 /DNA_START=81 /DNA_END=740 /DNA_ORIENTATION=-